jgi:replicative DNA helicase
MISKDTLRDQIERGRLGLNNGIPHGHEKLTEYIPNVQQSTYYLIGGELGTGKSAFTNDMFVYNPIDWYLDNRADTNIKLIIPYYSFEVPKRDMAIKYIARRIYKKYNILLDINYILSRGKYKISDEHYKLVMNEMPIFEELSDILLVQDLPKNPTGIWNDLLRLANDNGKGIKKVEGNNYHFEEGTDYVPTNPNLYVLPVIDHAGLTKKEREFSKKQVIDKLSEYMIILRNKCFYSPIVVQQLNRSLSSTDRFKIDKVEPQLSDFKESGNTQEDANVVLALFSPQRYELPKFREYNVARLRNRFRSISILKNRDGEADKILGMKFIGEVGMFQELKRGADMFDADYEEIAKITRSYKEAA